MINIAKLLKDCPKGTKLYSSVCGECGLKEVRETIGGTVIETEPYQNCSFDKYGRKYNDGECLLFPSKEVRDWGCFGVKYIRGAKGNTASSIDKFWHPTFMEHVYKNPDNISFIDRLTEREKVVEADSEIGKLILSTGTELKLEEKEQPKFKVGDVVKVKGFSTPAYGVVTKVNDTKIDWCAGNKSASNFLAIDATLATPEEIAKWNKEVLQPNHLHYSTSKRRMIDWFLPFDKVIVRDLTREELGKKSSLDFSYCIWEADFFDRYNFNDGQFLTTGGISYAHCLPYNEETAKLIGTTDEYKDN